MAAVLAFYGCTGSGAGCAALQPIPGGRYVGPKTDNAVNIRLSAAGVNYLNSHWRDLIAAFAPGQQISVPVPCIVQNIPVVGDVVIADQGSAGCGSESCGRMDGQCTTADVPANVVVTVTAFSLVPQPSDRIQATLTLAVNTGDLLVDTSDRTHGACTWLSPVKCAINFNTGAAGTPDNRLQATVRFSIDTKWDKLLAFEITNFSGTQVCGSSGAPSRPECLDPDDISFDGRNTCGNVYCGVADWDPLKSLVLRLISPILQDQISKVMGTQTCHACMSNADCPQSTDGANTQSTCNDGVCVDPATSKCVPRLLGVEGRMGIGALLSSFGAPADAAMDMSVAAGSTVVVDQGLTFGTRAGLKPLAVASCVLPAPAPPVVQVDPPDFDAEASPGSTYHVGLGISSSFLNTAFYAAHQSGALCLQLSSDSVGLINTGLFGTFLPSLSKLALRDGKDAPMMVVLRPARPPTMVVGEGTYDPVTKKPIKPLLKLSLPELSIDFYALIDDRFARLFTLKADVTMPLSLIFEGCDKVTPALGDLKMLISNISASNSEMLAEDPQVLADLIPAVIGLAEPALAKALKPFTLPSLGAFRLKVNEVKGIGNIPGSEEYRHLGIYAQMLGAMDQCAVSAPRLFASLKEGHIPPASAMRATGAGQLPWPEAVLAVEARGKPGTVEFAVRIDDGLWSDFVPAVNGELTVSHARFLIQGTHTISVRTRVAEDPHGISSPIDVGFVVDWDPPQVSLTADSQTDRVEVHARDVLSPAASLEFAYRVGTGDFTPFGRPRPISLSAVSQQGGVTVRVRDERGNVGEASWRPATLALRPPGDEPQALPSDPAAAGCSATGGLELFGLLALSAVLRRRRP